MINSRKIEDLQPAVAEKAKAFVAACLLEGIDILITSTLRDRESQASLYAKGRTQPGPRVTNARPGWSFHNWGLAFDFVPIVDGKAVWSDDHLWAKCGMIGEGLGLEWGGAWTGFQDKPHMQFTDGQTLAQLNAVASLA